MGTLCSQTIESLADQIAETAASLDIVTHTLLTQIRKFDRADGWVRMGALSCAHFLSWRIGMSLGVAREKVRVANALAELPLMDAELARGQLSYSKVRAMTRVAAPVNEAELLELARCTTAAQLEKICRLYRQTQELSASEARARDRNRWVSQRHTDDGMVRLSIQLLPEEAALVLKAIDHATSEGDPADRLVALAEHTLNGDAPPKAPAEISLHISAQTLTGHLEETDTGVSAETSRRLCCDAGIVPILENESGHTLDVGRKRRTVPTALRRALENRDGGCTFPGCSHRRVDAHHIEHWLDGGTTKLDNLISLCRTHHRYMHEYGFRVETVDSGAPLFHDPNGKALVAVPPRPKPRMSIELEEKPHSPIPNWDGTPPDYDWIVSGLAT